MNGFALWKFLFSPWLHFLVGFILVLVVCARTHTPIKKFLALDWRKFLLAVMLFYIELILLCMPLIIWELTIGAITPEVKTAWIYPGIIPFNFGGAALSIVLILGFLVLGVIIGVMLYYPLSCLMVWAWDKRKKGLKKHQEQK